MKTTTTVWLATLFLMGLMAMGCWSEPRDFWQGVDTGTGTASDTESDEPDGGECFETDSDDCLDAGL